MVNSDSDFHNSMKSDLFFTSDFIKNEICINILDKRNTTPREKQTRRKFEDRDENKRHKASTGRVSTPLNQNDADSPQKKRRDSVCLMFSSEMSDDIFHEIVRNSVDKKIEFLSISKKKHFTPFDDSFIFSSESNLSFDKANPKFKKGTTEVNEHIKIHSLDNFNDDNKILGSKPFRSHWTLMQKNNLRNYSVPESRLKNQLIQRKHLIDFWKNVEKEVQYSLPILGTGSSDSLMRISVDTVHNLLQNNSPVKFTIIDCRFEYEFQGGHIKNAININTTDKMDHFYRSRIPQIIIFHCEYSSIRAPRLAHYLRNKDRNENIYPNLKFSEIYIMEGGYKKFYEVFQFLCTPMHYVSMDDVVEKGGSKSTHLK